MEVHRQRIFQAYELPDPIRLPVPCRISGPWRRRAAAARGGPPVDRIRPQPTRRSHRQVAIGDRLGRRCARIRRAARLPAVAAARARDPRVVAGPGLLAHQPAGRPHRAVDAPRGLLQRRRLRRLGAGRPDHGGRDCRSGARRRLLHAEAGERLAPGIRAPGPHLPPVPRLVVDDRRRARPDHAVGLRRRRIGRRWRTAGAGGMSPALSAASRTWATSSRRSSVTTSSTRRRT